MHTRTHAHTHTHTHIHPYAHQSHTHTHIHTHQSLTHTHTHTHMYTPVTHARTHTHTHTKTQKTRTHTHKHQSVPAHPLKYTLQLVNDQLSPTLTTTNWVCLVLFCFLYNLYSSEFVMYREIIMPQHWKEYIDFNLLEWSCQICSQVSNLSPCSACETLSGMGGYGRCVVSKHCYS